MKTKNKRNYLKQNGITLIALVVTIVVLLILAGVSINAVFGQDGIIQKAKEAQNRMDEATENDLEEIDELNNWIDEQMGKALNISDLVGKEAVTKNRKAEDAYGNKITIPKGFKVVAHGTAAGSATYTYSGDNIPAVQDGIVIENGTDENQFVWIPVGTIKNKDNTTKTITLGRYSDFTAKSGVYTPVQVASVENCTQTVTISDCYQELSTFREGNSKTDSTAKNATARNLAKFISTTLSNGGYYIARFEASGDTSKIASKYNQTVLKNIDQQNAAKLAREMYGDIAEYASDLVNSYAWDTAIIFIQTYSTGEDASSYASKNKGPSDGQCNTGISNDKYCNIWDMSGNYFEWTTEYSTYSNGNFVNPNVRRGGCYDVFSSNTAVYTSFRYGYIPESTFNHGLRPLLYVK